MSKSVRVALRPIVYIDLIVDGDTEELALIEAEDKFNEMNIASVNMEIIQTDGTVHICHADDWKTGDYEFIDEED